MRVNFQLLYKACERQALARVEYLCSKGVNVNERIQNNNTLLHYAIIRKNYQIFECLLKHGADINARNRSGWTPLHMSCRYGNEEVFKQLLSKGANINDCTKEKETPIYIACKFNKESIAKILLELGADLTVCNICGHYPIHAACKYSSDTLVKLFLDKGTNINTVTSENVTPLHIASEWGQLNVVKLLLEKGADPNIICEGGCGPLYCAANGNPQVVEILLKYGANLEVRNHKDWTPLHSACYHGNLTVIKMLLDNGAKIEGFDALFYGGVKFEDIAATTPMHVATKQKHFQVVEFLLAYGVDPDLKNSDFQTPLHISCSNNDVQITKLLLDFGADVNCVDTRGAKVLPPCLPRCPISWRKPDLVILDLTLNKGYDFNTIDNLCSTLHDDVFKVYVKVLIKYKVANLYHGKNNIFYSSTRYDEEDSEFENNCVKEIEKLKMEKIANSAFSYYDSIVKTPFQLAKILKNKEIMKALCSCEDKFPIYYNMIENNLKLAYQRIVLSNLSVKYLNYLADYKLNILVIQMIIKFLRTSDLKNLDKAFTIKKIVKTISK